MRFEILIGDETISILVKPAEHMVHLMFAIKNAVLYLAHHSAQSPRLSFVFGAAQHGHVNVVQILVDEGGRGVGSCAVSAQVPDNLFLIISEHDVAHIGAFSVALCVVHE